MRTEVLGVGIGDILKFEATTLTRVKVKVPDGTRAGDWVNFSLRDNKAFWDSYHVKSVGCVSD